MAFGCRKASVCFFFPEFGTGEGVTTGAGVGVGVAAGAGAGNGDFFVKDVNVRELKSNEPDTQYLQRSVVPSGTSTTAHG